MILTLVSFSFVSAAVLLLLLTSTESRRWQLRRALAQLLLPLMQQPVRTPAARPWQLTSAESTAVQLARLMLQAVPRPARRRRQLTSTESTAAAALHRSSSLLHNTVVIYQSTSVQQQVYRTFKVYTLLPFVSHSQNHRIWTMRLLYVSWQIPDFVYDGERSSQKMLL